MCMIRYYQVKKVTGNNIICTCGTVVRKGKIESVVPGDMVEVYADIAITKLQASNTPVLSAEKSVHGI